MTELSEILAALESTFVILGVTIGGLWAYYVHIRGRVYRTRLEPKVTGRLVRKGNTVWVAARAQLRNVGLSLADLQQEGSGLRISGFEAGERLAHIYPIEWTHIATLPIFENH